MARCADCKITFENEAYKYCPLCGRKLENTITITRPTQPNPLIPVYPYFGDPTTTLPTTAPTNPFNPTVTQRTVLHGENGYTTYYDNTGGSL